MKRRFLINLLLICLLLGVVLPMAHATEATEETAAQSTEETTEETAPKYSTAQSGTCGDDLTWALEGHTLTITGKGEMDDGCPWEFYKDTIKTVIFSGDITTVGAEAFASCNNLEYVYFGEALVEIGAKAFYSCNALEAVRLPDTFRKFGAECFRDCENLKTVFCEGPMPSFKASCLYNDHTVVVYYTITTPWPQSEVDRLMSNFGGRIYVQLVTDEVQEELEENDRDNRTVEQTEPAPEETTEVTEAPTEPAPVMATEPPTQPATEPVVETTEATVPATEPETTAPVETQTPETQMTVPGETEPETMVEKAGSSGWIWIVAVAAGLTGLLVLALVIRSISHKGGRYSE